MRYLVFGDVHGNVEALDAVLAAADRRGIDACLFVGDLLGYGPSPLECIQRLQPLQQAERLAWVLGNHDLVVRGDIAPDNFGEEALQTLAWTRRLVLENPWALEFLATGQIVAKISGGIWLTHDSLAKPGSGSYHRATQNAEIELAQLVEYGGKVCFYGHTHTMRAELLLREGAVMLAPLAAQATDAADTSPLKLAFGERAWVGTGSTGFPTKAKGAAEFLILDDRDWSVEKYTVLYPREQARERVRAVLGGVCDSAVVERIARWL